MVENFFDDTFSQHSSNSKITKPKKDAKNKEDEASDKKKLKILKEALQDERKHKDELVM